MTKRSFRVVGLVKHNDHYTVAVLENGKDKSHDTGDLVSEFMNRREIGDDSLIGYYDDDERRILQSGMTQLGEDRNPQTQGTYYKDNS